MSAIPKNIETLADLIYKTYETAEAARPNRLTRIGASGIGDDCTRAIWFDWRGAYSDPISGRILRLFRSGFIQEDRMLEDLKNAGLGVWSHQEDGQQWTHIGGNGHFVAKLDGMIKGVPEAEKTIHTLEIKSSNLKGYDEMVKLGVQRSKPFHYAQMQAGMWLGGFKDALYIMICKDNEKVYAERVKYDAVEVEKLEAKLDSLVVKNGTIPPRITEKRDAWQCKFCDAKAVCWGEVPILQNCRTCAYSEPVDDGQWACNKLSTIRTPNEQLAGCDLWVSVL